MNYIDAINVIREKQSLGIKPGLSRIKNLLNDIGNPQDNIKIIHIAGTNGKGTVANTIYNALVKSGYKVGLFTSPWIEDYLEQIQINHELISEDDFTDYVNAYKDYDITEFELVTAIMYKYFFDNKVDYAIVECGMGGENDATNVEQNNICSVLTSVSLDHTDFLGDNIYDIAKEKAGIIKPKSTCVLYPNKDIKSIIKDKCDKINSKLIVVDEYKDIDINNLSVSKAVLSLLGIDNDVELFKPPCRQERIGSVILDGGHNVEAASFLAPIINDEIAIIGMMKDKDVDGYLSLVATKCRRIITTTPNNPRAMNCEDLKLIADKYCNDVIAINNPIDAISYGKEIGVTLVCGSFYLLREIRKELL